MDLKTIGEFLTQNQLSLNLILFVILFVYHKSQVAITEKLIDAQKTHSESSMKMQKESFERLIEQQNKREEQNFGLLKNMLESISYQSGLIIKLESSVQANQFCPLMRKGHKKENKLNEDNAG